MFESGTVSFLSEVLWDGAVALLAAWLAVRISLRQFASQRWWERQEEVYSKIIRALSQHLTALGKWEDHVLHQQGMGMPAGVGEQLKASRTEVELIAREGAFRISDKSAAELHGLIKKLNSWSDHPMEAIEKQWDAVQHSLEVITAEAKRELQLKRKWYRRR